MHACCRANDNVRAFSIMQKSPPPLSYNSLLDEHLAEYYSSPQRRRHLRRMGLITRDGRLVDERTFQRRATQREYRRRYRDEIETNAAATLTEKQWQQKAELKKKLETLAKYEMVQRVKKEKLHPPGIQTYDPKKALKQSLRGSGKTVPAKRMSPPPLTSLSDTCLSGAIEKHKDRVTFTPEELGELKHLVETIAGPRVTAQTIVQTKAVAHPLCATKPRTSAAKKGLGHRRPSTAPTKPLQRKTIRKPTEELVCRKSGVTVTLGYLGTTKALKKQKPLTEVEVWQQAQGNTPVRVFKGFIRAGENFSFQSIRHPGMPFALTIYTGGMIDCRVSVCCEYRHRARTRLGGPSAHFKVSSIKGGTPCHLCQKAREERKSKRKTLESTQSTPLLSSTMESTQLESLLTHSHVEGEGEGEISRSPSPTSSLYSASFHSESELSGDENEGGRRGSVDNPCSLSESQHLADLNKTQRDDADKGLNSGVNTTTDPVVNTEETKSLKEDGRKEGAVEARPELVTRGGVRIVYQLGPVPTSEHGTQTDEPLPQRGTQTDEPATTDTPQSGTETDQQAIANTPESETNEQANAEIATAEDKQAVESTRAVEDTSDPANPTPLPQAAIKANEIEEEDKPEQTAEEEKTSTEVASVHAESEIQPEKENESTPPNPADTSHTLPSLFNVSNNTTDTGDTKRANEDDSELTQVQNTARESLSSSEDNEPPADRSELDSISRSTLTDVSERTSNSPDSSSSSSISPSAPAEGGSQTDLSERADKMNQKEHQVAENQPEETEKREVVGEEEFTKAWT